MADRLHIPFDRERNNMLRGISRMASLEILLEKSLTPYTDAEKIAFAVEKNDTYRRLLKQMSPADLTDSVMHTLMLLREKGIKLAIGSSSRNAPLILERIGLSHFFDAVVDGNAIVHSKPHPEVFLKAAEMLGLEPLECLVVEDACAGVEAAFAGGFDCAAMNDAMGHPKANWHLDIFSDLLTI